MLKEMGFSQNVAEKALFLVQGGGVPKALEWIDAHQDDPDFQEELVIVGQAESKPKSTLTPEEKLAKAKELQERARQIRMHKEAEAAKESEEMRKRYDKEMAAAKKQAEEQEWKNAIEQRKREKAEQAKEMEIMRRKIEADKRERFGGKLPEEVKKPTKTPVEQIEHGITTVKTLYTEMRAPGVAKLCFKTACTFIRNLIKDPDNEKFRRINMDNEAVQKRVTKINGGLVILKGAGFTEAKDGTNSLVMETVDKQLLMKAEELLKPHFDE